MGQPAGGSGNRTPDTGLVIAGRYRIIRRIGRGGQSYVYEAEDTRLDLKVALKLLNLDLYPTPEDKAKARRRFLEEARIAASLRHSHIVEVSDVDESDGA
ncbi:unnamed protein product, partial [marine sediment metagenome]